MNKLLMNGGEIGIWHLAVCKALRSINHCVYTAIGSWRLADGQKRNR